MSATDREPARGVVLTPAEAANEGVETILDNLQRAGANAVAISPGVFVPTSPDKGVREPPLDIEGEARSLDRPLWGGTVQYLEGYSPYAPDPALWRDVPFRRPQAAPAELRTDFARRVTAAAMNRGMSAHIVTSPTLIPGLPGGQSFSAGEQTSTADHRTVRVDGSVARRSIAGQGCVNDPAIRALAKARITEILRHYPDVDGLFIDWAEYTCYLPQDIFSCFCAHCERAATEAGLPWDDIAHACRRILDGLDRLDDRNLVALIDAQPASIAAALQVLTGVEDDTRALFGLLEGFKATSVASFYDWTRQLITRSDSDVAIGGNAFPPPWNRVTGSDPNVLDGTVEVIRTKLFTFHWPMMTRWFCETMLEHNSGLTPRLVLEATKTLFQVPTGAAEHRVSIDDYRMPRPDEPHPITMAALRHKLTEMHTTEPGATRVEAYLHSYGPVGEFARILELPAEGTGVWVQRYGYLSDAKLEVLTSAWAGSS